MIIARRLLVEDYFGARKSRADIRAATRQFDAWLAEVTAAAWKNPAEVKRTYGAASILGGNRVVFNISGNRYRLVTQVNYVAQVVEIRFFGSHAEYDRIDAETI